MPASGKELMMRIGSALGLGPGTSVKELQRAVALETGIGHRSLERCWKGQYASKTTISKLQKAANNADKFASQLDALANDAEMAGRPRREVDILRAAAHSLRDGDL